MASDNSYDPSQDTIDILMTGLLPAFIICLFEVYIAGSGITCTNNFDERRCKMLMIFSGSGLLLGIWGAVFGSLINACIVLSYHYEEVSWDENISTKLKPLSRLYEHYSDNEPKKLVTATSYFLKFNSIMCDKKKDMRRIRRSDRMFRTKALNSQIDILLGLLDDLYLEENKENKEKSIEEKKEKIIEIKKERKLRKHLYNPKLLKN
ncbi:6872_t:CDS:2 [Gigaspora margarita]|uniref:6872_t:CDS:1 n=1 Tax=Gigaspora margarita TaxID=4874 RepID=A0ABN7UMA6_GIGMA|nr:6872_t:CDS:2 [Gigaspora margarita]